MAIFFSWEPALTDGRDPDPNPNLRDIFSPNPDPDIGIFLCQSRYFLPRISKGLDEINLSPPTPRHKDLWPTHSIDQLQSHVFVSPIEKEVKKFESLPKASKDDDILKWWKFYSEGLPILSSVIRAILAINVV